MSKIRFLFCLGFLAAASGAFAAPESKDEKRYKQVTGGPPMEVVIVRSNEPGCEPNCLEWIAAQGRIDANSPLRFKKALAQAGPRKLPVLIHSPGGSVSDALAIGRMIRAKGLDVVVSKTEVAKCAPADTACQKLKTRSVSLGSPVTFGSACASSCPFILAGGVRRLVGPGTAVGVHRISSFQIYTKVIRQYRIVTKTQWGLPVAREKQIVAEKPVSRTVVPTITSDKTYVEIRQHFEQMGISADIMPLVQRTPSESLRWLTAKELTGFKLSTAYVNGEMLIKTTKVKVVPPVGTGLCQPSLGIRSGCGDGGAPVPAAVSPMQTFGVDGVTVSTRQGTFAPAGTRPARSPPTQSPAPGSSGSD